MPPVPTLLNVFRETLKTLQGSREFLADDPQVHALRRWLLLTIADLEDQERRIRPPGPKAA
jgi:hypothetical protein